MLPSISHQSPHSYDCHLIRIYACHATPVNHSNKRNTHFFSLSLTFSSTSQSHQQTTDINFTNCTSILLLFVTWYQRTFQYVLPPNILSCRPIHIASVSSYPPVLTIRWYYDTYLLRNTRSNRSILTYQQFKVCARKSSLVTNKVCQQILRNWNHKPASSNIFRHSFNLYTTITFHFAALPQLLPSQPFNHRLCWLLCLLLLIAHQQID